MDAAKTSGLFPKPVIKSGITFGVVSAVLALLSVIPILGIFFSLINWLVGILSGYTVTAVTGGTKEKLADVIKNSAITGVIAGVIAGLGGGVASVINGLFISRISFFGVYYTPGLADFISWFVGAMIWGVIGMVIWNIIGGVVEVYYTSDKLPESLRVQFDKVKAFVTK